jgi:nicotinamide-nucleotide amidase
MDVSQEELEALAAELGATLLARGWMLAAAESCTGGWAAQALTAVAGSSVWFERGFVTYSNAAKREMLGVRAATLEAHGAVSEETAREMASGALAHSQAAAAFAITGIAGPTGGTPEKPVGTVCFAWAGTGFETVAERLVFPGDRRSIRAQSVRHALKKLLALMP